MIINIYVNKYLCKWKYLCIWKMTSNTFSICTVKHPPPLHESALNNCLSVFCNPCCVPRWCWWPSRRCWASPPYVCTPWGRRPPRGWFLDRRYVSALPSSHTVWVKMRVGCRCHTLVLPLSPQLNVYTPVQPSARVEFAPEKPGVVESGVTTARETITPLYLAVKVSHLLHTC